VVSEERFQEMLAGVVARRQVEELAVATIASGLLAKGHPVAEVPELAAKLWGQCIRERATESVAICATHSKPASARQKFKAELRRRKAATVEQQS
jgi:hypothetical protein